MLFRIRMHLLCGLKRYGDSINSRHLFCRGDLLALVQGAPNAFVGRQLLPEHRCTFGVEPKRPRQPHLSDPTTPHNDHFGFDQDDHAPPATTHGAGGGVGGASPAGDPFANGKLTLVVDQLTPKRFYPFPRWLANHWNHAPMPVVRQLQQTRMHARTQQPHTRAACTHKEQERNQGSSQSHSVVVLAVALLCFALLCFALLCFVVSDGFTSSGVRADLSSRLTELLQEGLQVSVLPDVSLPGAMEARQRQQQQQSNLPADGSGDGGEEGWSASNFLKLSFCSVEEARNRALVLALNTWQPSFHLLRASRGQQQLQGPLTAATPPSLLAGSQTAFLMTPQHMTLCLQYQQGSLLNRHHACTHIHARTDTRLKLQPLIIHLLRASRVVFVCCSPLSVPAGGPSGPSGERHILYTTFWTVSNNQ